MRSTLGGATHQQAGRSKLCLGLEHNSLRMLTLLVLSRWGELIYQWVKHSVERYGKDEVETWYWEVFKYTSCMEQDECVILI